MKINNKNSLEVKLQKLIKLLSVMKKISNNIIDDEVSDMFLEYADEDSLSKKFKKVILESRICAGELYNSCRKYIDENFVVSIQKMVEQQGMCIHYNNKDYRLIKVYDPSIENGVGYVFDEYKKTNIFSEISNFVRITIKDDKVLYADDMIMQGILKDSNTNYNRKNIEDVLKSIEENKAIDEQGRAWRMVEDSKTLNNNEESKKTLSKKIIKFNKY